MSSKLEKLALSIESISGSVRATERGGDGLRASGQGYFYFGFYYYACVAGGLLRVREADGVP